MKTIKPIIIASVAALCCLHTTAATDNLTPTPKAIDLTELLADAPATVFPTIDRTTRLDMIDYFMAGSDKSSKNAMDGACRVISLSPKQIVVQTSNVSRTQLALLPYKNDTIIMAITTVKMPAEDSRVDFYDLDWQQIANMPLPSPKLSDWLVANSGIAREDVENALPFITTCITANTEGADATSITFTNTSASYLPADDAKIALKATLPAITYMWNGRKWQKVAN